MPVAPNTSSSMIVRTANPNAGYTIYNLGLNQILLGQDLISAQQIGSDWDFAGPGAVNFDFTGNTLDLWVKRTTTQETDGVVVNQFNEFSVYSISGNAIKSYDVFSVLLDRIGRSRGSVTSLGVTSKRGQWMIGPGPTW